MATCVRIKNREKGVTLVELLVYMAMLGVALTALFQVFISSMQTYESTESMLVLRQDMRAAMNILSRDIRMSGCDPHPKDSPSFGFVTGVDDDHNTDANSIHFTSDFLPRTTSSMGDDLTNDVSEDVCYFLSNGSLMREARYVTGGAVSAEPVIDNVTDLQFAYYDNAVLTTADLTKIAFVDILLTGQTEYRDKKFKKPMTMTMTIRLCIRNSYYKS